MGGVIEKQIERHLVKEQNKRDNELRELTPIIEWLRAYAKREFIALHLALIDKEQHSLSRKITVVRRPTGTAHKPAVTKSGIRLVSNQGPVVAYVEGQTYHVLGFPLVTSTSDRFLCDVLIEYPACEKCGAANDVGRMYVDCNNTVVCWKCTCEGEYNEVNLKATIVSVFGHDYTDLVREGFAVTGHRLKRTPVARDNYDKIRYNFDNSNVLDQLVVAAVNRKQLLFTSLARLGTSYGGRFNPKGYMMGSDRELLSIAREVKMFY